MSNETPSKYCFAYLNYSYGIAASRSSIPIEDSIEKFFQLSDADFEVSVGESVRKAEAHSSVVRPRSRNRVKHAQSKQHLAPGLALRLRLVAVDEFAVAEMERVL